MKLSETGRGRRALDVGIMPRFPAGKAVALAVEAEERGFAGVWIADSQSESREAFTLLGACAMRTERLLLATGVTNPVTRHVTVLASAFATLEELAPGRVVAVIGAGDTSVRSIGLPPATRVQLADAVESLRALVRGERADVDGHDVAVAWAKQPLPVFVTASAPKNLRLAGAVGDGVLFQVGAHPDLIRYALREIGAGAAETGRSLSDLVLCARVGCAVDDDVDKAREALQAYAPFALRTLRESVPRDELPVDPDDDEALRDAALIADTPDRAAERLQAIYDLGVQRVVVPALGVGLAPLAEHVLPQLR
jgi:5,10-methylenetetrahydromethanopterin reductase